MKFLELTTRTYIGKEFRQYVNSSEVDLDEGDEWKKAQLQEALPPKGHLTRIYIDPEDIRMYGETFSLEEMHNNPENPTLDSVDVTLKSGEIICAAITLSDFQKKLQKHYKLDIY